MQVGSLAAVVQVEQFRPQQGVKIETDPNATTVNELSASDDGSAINQLAGKLEVRTIFCP